MALPTAGQITAAPLVPDLQGYLEEVRDAIAELGGAVAVQALTLSGTTITPADGASSVITVDTGGPATGTLSTIALTNTHSGQIIRLSMANASRVVTVDNGAGGSGQIITVDGADFDLDALDKWIELELSGTSWTEIARSFGNSPYEVQDHFAIAPVPAHNTLCPHERLAISYASAATITITADAVVLKDSSGHLKRFSPLSETLTISSTGANGRDVVDNAGAEDDDAWYHLFAIGKDNGDLDVFASQVGYPGHATSIFTRLPAGYSWCGYLGAAYNDSLKNLLNFKQVGDEVACAARTMVSSGVQTSITSVSLAAIVPPTARSVSGWIELSTAGGSISGQATLWADNTAGFNAQLLWATISNSFPAVGNFDIALITAQTVYYKTNSASALFDAAATGWRY